MMSRIYDVAYELEDDQVHVEQSSGCGEVDRVTLHRVHVAHLAGLLGLLKPDSPANLQTSCTLARENATLRRRMRTLHRRISELDAHLWSVPIYPPGGDVGEDCRLSQALLDLADDFLADMDDEAPNEEPAHSPAPAPETGPRSTQQPQLDLLEAA